MIRLLWKGGLFHINKCVQCVINPKSMLAFCAVLNVSYILFPGDLFQGVYLSSIRV